MSNTDEFKQLQELDGQHIFDVIDTQPNQLRANYADSMREDITETDGEGITSVIIAGMGGSELAGSIIKNWLYSRLKMPIDFVRGGTLPGYVNNHTLVIISSYSGNTAETLMAYSQATKNNCQIICITNGGELAKLATANNDTILQLPDVSQPRLAVFACLKALACILADMDLVEEVDLRRELIDAADYLDTIKMTWSPDMVDSNLAKEIAQEFYGKEVVIYSSPLLAAASYKWKIDINENAKQMAHSNVFSELNHNEMQGWLFPKQKSLASIVLQSSFDDPEIAKRITTTQEVLKSHGFIPQVVTATGANQIQQLLCTIILGDYVSAYLAILNKVNPTPVGLVEEFKKKLI